MDEYECVQVGMVTLTNQLMQAVAPEDVALAVSKHWQGLNGDGSKVMIFPGLPALSHHTGMNGCRFVVMTSASAEETIAMLSSEL